VYVYVGANWDGTVYRQGATPQRWGRGIHTRWCCAPK